MAMIMIFPRNFLAAIVPRRKGSLLRVKMSIRFRRENKRGTVKSWKSFAKALWFLQTARIRKCVLQKSLQFGNDGKVINLGTQLRVVDKFFRHLTWQFSWDYSFFVNATLSKNKLRYFLLCRLQCGAWSLCSNFWNLVGNYKKQRTEKSMPPGSKGSHNCQGNAQATCKGSRRVKQCQ